MGSIDKTPPQQEAARLETLQVKKKQPKAKTSPAATGAGRFGEHAVTRLEPVPKPDTNTQFETLMDILQKALQKNERSSESSSPNTREGELHYALKRLMSLVAGSDASDVALRAATEKLSSALTERTPSLNAQEAEAQDENLRDAADDFRMERGLEGLKMTSSRAATQEARLRLMDWLSPYRSDENRESQGHSAFRRLLKAAQVLKNDLGPDFAARLMAWAFESKFMPITKESGDDLKILWSCLYGTKSPDLIDAQRLLNLYRDAIDRHSPNAP